jgi:uncharacterized protein YbjT (DUF2867 family)
MKVLVLGGTGNVGRPLALELVTRGVPVRVASRGSGHGLPPGAELARVELDDPATFAAALEGVDRVFFMSRTGEARPLEVGLSMLKAMQLAGVRHVVDMTGLGVERNEALPLRQLELAFERSGLSWTHLRPNFFFQNFCAGALRAGLLERDELAVAVGEARISFVDARDIAAVALEALLDRSLAGRGLAITGAVGVTHHDIAQAIGEATGRPIRFRALTDDQARVDLAATGLSSERIEARLRFLALAKTGALAASSPDVAEVLARPPISLQTFARDHAACWTGGTPS